MKKTIIWIAVALLCVGLMAGVYALYNNLSEKYEPDMPILPNVPSRPETETAGGDEPETHAPDSSVGESDGADSAPESVPDSAPESEVSEYIAPDFRVYDADGNAVRLSDYFGQPIVLNFWATWCYYCKVEMPDFDEIARKYPDVKFLMVNATGTNGETVETAKKYVEDNGFEFNVLYDVEQNALMTYGITSFPTTFFIASNGDLYTYVSGMLDGDRLEEIIKTVKEYK